MFFSVRSQFPHRVFFKSRGNLVGLRWDWVQEQGAVLVVPRPHVKAKKRAVMVPLTRRAAAIIQRQVRRLGCPTVFTQADGSPYRPDQVGVAVVRAAKRAGLPGVSLHTLRHTFISRLVQAGRPLPEVAALAGHRSLTMTLRYAHLTSSHLREGIRVLEQVARTGRKPARPGLSTEGRVTLASREIS